MRVQPLDDEGQHSSSFNLLAAKTYFTQLQTGTQAKYCTEMLEKLKEIEEKHVEIPETVYSFLTQQQERIEQIHALTADELDQLNRGTDLKEILLEREILKKFS